MCLKKLNLSILHWVQFCLITLKRKQIQIRLILKKDKNLIYNSQHSFTKFKDIDEFKELSLDSMYKKLNDLKKKDLISLKLLIHKQMKIKHSSQKF